MIHDSAVLDFLSSQTPEPFEDNVYRITPTGRKPYIYSTAGGRWMPRDGMAVLYTSLTREGALAEISFRLSQQTPIPSMALTLHELLVTAKKLVRISASDFAALGIDPTRFRDIDYLRTQVIGDAVGFLEFDAMLVPSARWDCDNLVLLADHQDIASPPTVIKSEGVDWKQWATENGFI